MKTSAKRVAVSMLMLLSAAAGAAETGNIQALLACRLLAPGAARVDCFERTSADLEREVAHPVAVVGSPSTLAHPVRPAAIDSDVGRKRVALMRLSYEDGRPVFLLENGQEWVSREERRLTPDPGGDRVTIEPSPVGFFLHFNGSLFGLPVQRRR